jgi:hypothetical protein
MTPERNPNIDMSPEAIEARLRLCNPPDLRPEHRLHHKLDMSPVGVESRLRQVAALHRLSQWLTSRAPTDDAASR